MGNIEFLLIFTWELEQHLILLNQLKLLLASAITQNLKMIC